ncbi:MULTISPECIES: HAD family hydrolase [Bacillaceae]|uniref:HAD family hydrolase n=1 Tax=Bacillaceae TaxID=186817 RepID=UPI00069D10FB|nr:MULTISPECIES: HAD family hydrolase [Bacillaceae]MBU0443849.1 HAD family hydrolase [Bacillus amyloliquefaciens]MDH3100004.1 HAD family hydrolase [Bacillus velezensis]QLG06693.1 HAD-IA family hydrolase [Bacillus velezensis]WGE01025.1 HAD family hydrolase [Bacillus velezensis]WRT05828.1 HAD family hydrolase [Bacillus velezensis]
MFKNIIFDVDGTILDTEKAILKSLQKVLKEEGKDYQLEDLRFALGIPGIETLKKLNVTDLERVHPKWSETVLEFSHEVSVFKDLENVIKTLSESPVRTGIVTSKTKQELIDEFEPFGLSSFFEYTICASDTEKHKPHPEPLLACLKGLNAVQEETIYIGDSIYDMQCSKSAGVKFALALWGSKTTEGFESADYILKNPKDILDLIALR